MPWAYDWPRIKEEHMKHNPFIKEAAEHREVRCTEQEGGPGRWEEDLTAEEVSPGLACHGGQLPCAAPPPRSKLFRLEANQTRGQET